MLSFNEYVKIISKTFSKEQIEEILSTPKIFFDDCHVLYPADKTGSHLLRFFDITSIANPRHCYVEWIADDIFQWIEREEIDIDVVFAKGNTGLITEVERTYGPKFYSAIQVDIPVYKPENCPKCLAGDRDSLQPWVELVSS